MKIFVISDIHGSIKYLRDFMNIFNKENGDTLVILGDVLYHGPRNPLPLEYNPLEVIKLLNEYKEKIIWVKGNCDGEVDEMVLDFKYVERGILFYNNRKIYLTHGHKENVDNFKLLKNDVLLHGHSHVNFIKEKDGCIIANPGSLSLPKENTKNSYLIIDDNKLAIYSLEQEKLYEINL